MPLSPRRLPLAALLASAALLVAATPASPAGRMVVFGAASGSHLTLTASGDDIQVDGYMATVDPSGCRLARSRLRAVCTVVGARPFGFIPHDYDRPIVISGFEPLDILQSILMILSQLRTGRCEVENQYKRVVPEEGNLRALQVMSEVFALRPHFEWRGLGFISQSALRLSDAYAAFDAEQRFPTPNVRVADPKACQCGEVLKGVIKPWECKVFGTACTPEHAIGTCMVSPEGACAAYYNFGRYAREREAV